MQHLFYKIKYCLNLQPRRRAAASSSRSAVYGRQKMSVYVTCEQSLSLTPREGKGREPFVQGVGKVLLAGCPQCGWDYNFHLRKVQF